MITIPDTGTIRAFLFYEETGWPLLFSRLLKPLIDDLQQKRRIRQFSLFLQKNRGDHIRMALYPLVEDAANSSVLKNQVEVAIKSFFDRYPGAAASFPSTGEYFFMDFPPNSLYFDLPDRHPQQWKNPLPVDDKPLAHEISEVLLATMATEDTNYTRQITVALYLELALLKAMEPHLLKRSQTSLDATGSRVIEMAIPNGRHILMEMKNEMRSAENNHLSWLHNWMELCIDVFLKASVIDAIEYTDLVSAALFRHFNLPFHLASALHTHLKNDLQS